MSRASALACRQAAAGLVVTEVPAPSASAERDLPAPLGLLAELTHRCPLGCPYCSNPLALERRRTNSIPRPGRGCFVRPRRWAFCKSISRAASRPRAATSRRSSNRRTGRSCTPTSSPPVSASPRAVARLADAGSITSRCRSRTRTPYSADRIAGYEGAFARKQAVAAETVRLGLPLTINVVVHRANIERIDEMVELALALRPTESRSPMCSITAGR